MRILIKERTQIVSINFENSAKKLTFKKFRYRFLRSKDRETNQTCYPKLDYPEIYILDGGYKAFYEKFQVIFHNTSFILFRYISRDSRFRQNDLSFTLLVASLATFPPQESTRFLLLQTCKTSRHLAQVNSTAFQLSPTNFSSTFDLTNRLLLTVPHFLEFISSFLIQTFERS